MYHDDPEANLELYRKILRILPKIPASLELTKMIGNSMVILEVFKSEIDLRGDFKQSKKYMCEEELDRYSWLKKCIKEKGIVKLVFSLEELSKLSLILQASEPGGI